MGKGKVSSQSKNNSTNNSLLNGPTNTHVADPADATRFASLDFLTGGAGINPTFTTQKRNLTQKPEDIATKLKSKVYMHDMPSQWGPQRTGQSLGPGLHTDENVEIEAWLRPNGLTPSKYQGKK